MRLKILQSSFVKGCQAVVSKCFKEYASLQVLVSGRINLSVDGEERTVESPYVWYTVPGPHYAYASTGDKPWNHCFVSFAGPLMEEWMANGILFKAGYPCKQTTVDWLLANVEKIAAEQRRLDLYSQDLSINLLENLVLTLARRRNADSGETNLRESVLEYIQAKQFQPAGYEDLAKALDMGYSTLRSKFRQEVGMPLHKFTEHQRINQCKAHLEAGSLPLKEIARRMGYPDVYYFSRHFHKITGIPPGAYRDLFNPGRG